MTAEDERNGRPEVLDRATIRARRDVLHTELLAHMQAVERFRGALGILDELLLLADPGESGP